MSWFAKRFARLVVILLALTMLSFGAQSLLPGDPAQLIGFGADEARVEEIRTDLQLDEPVTVRYLAWLSGFVRGDLGPYYRIKGASPSESVRQSLPNSLLLMLYTQLLSLAIAVPLGVITAYRRTGAIDKGVNAAAFVGLAVPGFVLAFLLKKYLAVDRRILPDRGWVPLTEDPVEHLRYAVLPVLSLALGQIAVYMRLLRSDMIATLDEEFILMARSKGITPRRVLFRHALRPSSLTLVTVAGMNVGILISATVLVERVFGVPGMGNLLVEGILSREYPATQSFIAIMGIIFVLVNYGVDLLYGILDPRVRHG
jgi:peptide/nickel transport system permease protein